MVTDPVTKKSEYMEEIIMNKIVTDKAPQAIGPYSQGMTLSGSILHPARYRWIPLPERWEERTIEVQAEQSL